MAAHSEDAVYILPLGAFHAPFEGDALSAPDVPSADWDAVDWDADSEDCEDVNDGVVDDEEDVASVTVVADRVTVSAVVDCATDVSVTTGPEADPVAVVRSCVPVMGIGVEMMLVRAVTSSVPVVSLASLVVAGAVDAEDDTDAEPPEIVNWGLELPESPNRTMI